MKKILLSLVLACLAITSLQAQEKRERGFYLGADRDTIQYIVASPFDNWFLSAGIGGQTFIGNEAEDTARWNNLDFKAYIEVGKWLIPDIAVSLWLSYYTLSSQTVYGRHPYIDYEYHALHPEEYLDFTAHAFSVGGLVTLDWTNLFNGYEKGLLKKWHFMTPVGLGFGVNWKRQLSNNPKLIAEGHEVGDIRRNVELYYTAAFLVEYSINPQIKLDLSARFAGARGSYDSYHDHSDRSARQDFMPSITAGVRFNLLKHVTKVDPRTGRRIKDATVYHTFQPADQSRAERLIVQLDSLQACVLVDDMKDQEELDRLYAQIDSLKDVMAEEDISSNPMLEIDLAAGRLKLPIARVYYELDSYDLDYNARKILHQFAIQIKNDTTETQYFIIGAADEQTGTPEHNQKLSSNRCQSVYKVLTGSYGIPKERLKVFPLGGITEYEPQEFNRTCLIVQSDSEFTRIIDKWKAEK